MMSPERQLVAPFFLGGETILVAYPTDGMTHEQKMMSMRGNNPHFAHATVFHELIPGHHLQLSIAQLSTELPMLRRTAFYSAYGEGWALYTEKLGVEMGMYKTPYEDFGRLSYEMWRAARLVIDTGIHRYGWSRQ